MAPACSTDLAVWAESDPRSRQADMFVLTISYSWLRRDEGNRNRPIENAEREYVPGKPKGDKMSETERAKTRNRVGRELRDPNPVSGGAPVDKNRTPPSAHEPTKHPAKVTIPDLK